MNGPQTEIFNMPAALKQQHLQPFCRSHSTGLTSCALCRYINSSSYHFCTNCGHPLKAALHAQALFGLRNRKRKDLLKKRDTAIQRARFTLYAMAAFCFTGMALVFSSVNERYIYTLLFAVCGVMYLVLARWSLRKPFTAFTVSVVMIFTFTILTLSGQLSEVFTTVRGLYEMIFMLIIIVLMIRGMSAAYQAGYLDDEQQII